MKKLTKEEAAEILSCPNGSQELLKDADSAFEAAWLLMAEGNAAAVGFLCKAAAKKRFAKELERLIEKHDMVIFDCMASEDAKMRKNSARLIGALKNEGFVPMLIGALEYETVRFVRPSIILALGSAGGEEAEEFLKQYTVAPAENEQEEKHYKEECEALSKALSSFVRSEKHTFIGLTEEYEIEIRCPEKLSASLADELSTLGTECEKQFSNAVRVKTKDINALYKARCFFEVLFPVISGTSADPKVLAKHIVPFMQKLLPSCHSGSNTFAYRIEIKGDNVDRAEKAKALAKLLDAKNTIESIGTKDNILYLVNSPSDYEVEIRIEIHSGGSADAYIKLYTVRDERFAYRKGSLPASMNPATAAAVLRMAKEYLTDGARVLDPCCGSGTLLIEREKLKPVMGSTGVDIAHKAIDIARENAMAAEAKAKFVVNDCLRFEAKRKYDELVSNLPFGNRVGSHKNNEILYRGILDRMHSWVKQNGIAILYTMEFTLLKKLIRERNDLELLSEARTDAGGLTPTIFVLRIK
ncbi:MAG: methyltransferase [Clostridia bacterium]|nr:methyltransferase [Clostridia bacterium]